MPSRPYRSSQRSTIHVGWLAAIASASAALPSASLGEGTLFDARMRATLRSTPAPRSPGLSVACQPMISDKLPN